MQERHERMNRERLANVDELPRFFIERVESIFHRHGRRLPLAG